MDPPAPAGKGGKGPPAHTLGQGPGVKGKGKDDGKAKAGGKAQPTRPEKTKWEGKDSGVLRWERRLAGKDDIRESAFQGEELPVLEELLENKFVKKKEDKEKEVVAAPVAVAKPVLWDPTEKQAAGAVRQNLAISMVWWGKRGDVFFKRLRAYDFFGVMEDPGFEKDRFDKLVETVGAMSADEWGRLKEENARTVYEWDDNLEGFFRELGKIPKFKERLLAVASHLNIDCRLMALSQRVQSMGEAMHAVKASETLPQVFRKILTIGNCFNAGNSQLGRADGFDAIKLLEQHLLNDMPKSTDGKTSLLQYMKEHELSEDQGDHFRQLAVQLQAWPFPFEPTNPKELETWVDPTDLRELQNDHGEITRDLASLEKTTKMSIKDRTATLATGVAPPGQDLEQMEAEIAALQQLDTVLLGQRSFVDKIDASLEELKHDLPALHAFFMHKPPQKRDLSAGKVLGVVSKLAKLLVPNEKKKVKKKIVRKPKGDAETL